MEGRLKSLTQATFFHTLQGYIGRDSHSKHLATDTAQVLTNQKDIVNGNQ